MGRLIDADALIQMFKMANESVSVQTDVGMPLVDGSRRALPVLLDGIVRTLQSLPTVDAVPVEWLQEKMLEPQMTTGNPFGFVLAEWLDDQEAR